MGSASYGRGTGDPVHGAGGGEHRDRGGREGDWRGERFRSFVELLDVEAATIEAVLDELDGARDRDPAAGRTVHRHMANIRTKLRQPTRTAAATEAARLQLI